MDCNPFLPERLELERRALGDAFTPVAAVWHAADDADGGDHPNAVRLRAEVERIGTQLQQRLAAGAAATPAERATIGPDHPLSVVAALRGRLVHLDPPPAGIPPRATAPVSRQDKFAAAVGAFLRRRALAGAGREPADPAHLFALGYQARRAFDYIFRQIFGASLPIARLRAALWESCFTAVVRSYRAELYATMAQASRR